MAEDLRDNPVITMQDFPLSKASVSSYEKQKVYLCRNCFLNVWHL